MRILALPLLVTGIALCFLPACTNSPKPLVCTTDKDCPANVPSCRKGGCLACPVCLPSEACVAAACAPVNCGDHPCHQGQACVDGQCRESECVGVSCPAGQACAKGSCFPVDCEGQHCAPGDLCQSDACAFAGCVGVTCLPGQVCADSHCLSQSCAGVVCATGAACSNGRCVPTPCIGVSCIQGLVCVQGNCVPQDCAGVTCATGAACVDGACQQAACVGVTCAAGSMCGNGACLSTSCNGDPCPVGQACVGGACSDPACVGMSCPAAWFCAKSACLPCQATESNCGDGLDEDCDGTTDCADSDCAGTDACGGSLVLKGSGGSTVNGAAIKDCGGSDACDAAHPYVISARRSYRSVVMLSGAAISIPAWTGGVPGPGNGVLDLLVNGDFNLCATCSILLDGKGWGPSSGPGASGGDSGGGAHGGNGGAGHYGAGSPADDELTAPILPGSGGRAACGHTGGTGGGLLVLKVGGKLTLDGTISASGLGPPGDPGCAGGGAGGGISITAATLAGSYGTLRADGGPGPHPEGGGGGGGRIAVVYNADATLSGTAALTLSAHGGSGGWQSGGAGTIYLKHAGVDAQGNLRVDNAGLAGSATTPLAASTAFDDLAIAHAGNLEIGAGNTLASTTTHYDHGLITNHGSYLNALGTVASLEVINDGTLNIPGGNLTIAADGILDAASVTPVSLTSLTILKGGKLTHLPNSTTRAAMLDVVVTGDLKLDEGGAINVDGRGYATTLGPSANGGDSGGAGHGGNGGAGHYGGGGTPYDDLRDPSLLGSGGRGACGHSGSSGGGLVKLQVDGQLILNGSISADGLGPPGDPGCAGTGSGGTVNLTVGTLSGSTGTVTARGGSAAHPEGGAGSGGRIAVAFGTDSYAGGIASLVKSARGGSGGWQGGGAGTIYLFHQGVDVKGWLVVDNGGVDGAPTPLLASDDFDRISIANKGNLLIPAGMTLHSTTTDFPGGGILTVDGSFLNPLPTIAGVEVVHAGTLNIPGTNLTIGAGGALTIANLAPLHLTSLHILPGGRLGHAANGADKTAALDLTVSGNLTLDDGGAINADGRGYATVLGPGANGGDSSGAGHGGYGGGGHYGSGGAPYDDLRNPVLLGSGGRGACGHAGSSGGGAIKVDVGGQLILNGSISADGLGPPGDPGCAGTGSGGSINLTLGVLSGSSGAVTARGGSAAHPEGGSGSGGRIAIAYGTDSYTGGIGALVKSARGGAGGWQAGGAGTIFLLRQGVDVHGSLRVDNGGVDGAPTPLLTSDDFDKLTVSNKGNLVIPTGMTLHSTTTDFPGGGVLTVNGSFLNPLPTIAGVEIVHAGNLNIPGDDLTIGAGGSLTIASQSPLLLANLTILTGGRLSHSSNATAAIASIDLTVTGKLQLDEGGTIDVAGKGFGPGYGPGAATGSRAGGGHGGPGAASLYASASEVYGNLLDPLDLGSGGGGGCNNIPGSGGGRVAINAPGRLILQGAIVADGTAAQDCNGGGSGGSVSLNVNSLEGTTGTISANGGGATDGNAGSGGGGRIAVTYVVDKFINGISSLSMSARGGTGPHPGGAGTVYLLQTGVDTHGRLRMDNANLVGPASPLLTSFTFDDLSLRRSANLLVPTATSLTVATTSSSGGILTNQGTYTPSSSTIVGMEVVNSGALVLPNNDATLAGSGTLTVANNDLTIHSMVIQSGGRLSHVANAAAQTNVLRLTASSLQLDYGGAITVDGKGFAGQSGPGAGAYEATAGTGAGHGGPGGASQTSSTVGPAYDDPDSPIFVGSGGGNSSCGGTDGGAGGGLANLNVLGTLTLNGNITANGLSGTCRGGGGAGGTVFITAGVLAGVTGTLHADGGGVADGRAGTGGGGRVKLVYTTDSFTGGVANLVRTANGGTGGFANGTAGSVK